MAKEVRLEIKPRNNLVLLKMEEAGICSVAKLCRQFGLNQVRVGALINMKMSPMLKRSSPDQPVWAKEVVVLARNFKCLPEDLFPESIRDLQVKSKFHVELAVDDLKRLRGRVPAHLQLAANPDFIHIRSEVERKLGEMLKTLTLREERVLRLRFGLEDGQEHTLEEVGALFGVSKDRIRQIQDKALRKMRHPARTRPIRAAGLDQYLSR